jgi:hypothetical protein
MDLPSLVRKVIDGPVKKNLGSMRTEVFHSALGEPGVYGPTYGEPVKRLAMVESTSQLVTKADGTDAVSIAKYTFLEPIAIKEGDRLTFNGITADVVKVSGVMDPDPTNKYKRPYLPEAWTGRSGGTGRPGV